MQLRCYDGPRIGDQIMQVLEQTTEVSFSPLLRRYTLEEFWGLPDPGEKV